MKNLDELAKRLKNIGMLIGFPSIIVFAGYYHNAQMSLLKTENDFLRQTQYDKALLMIEAQNKLRENERRIVAEALSEVNQLMADVEKFTHFEQLPEDFSTDEFERDIQSTATKLKELHTLMIPVKN